MKSKGALLILAFFMASLNLRPAITSIAPLLETLRDQLAMSASVASLLTSIPVFCMGIFSPMAAALGARFGIERVIGWSLALIGVGTALRFFTHSTFFLMVTAFVAGLGIASAGPLLSGFIKRYFPTRVPTMIGLFSVALTIGASLGSGLAAPFQSQTHSWQGALAVWALLAFIAVPIWWMSLRRAGGRGDGNAASAQTASLPWGQKKAWLLTLSFGFMAMMFYSITAWLPPIIEGLGYSKVYAGNVLTLFALVQVPVSLFLPALLKRYPARLPWMLLCSAFELVGLSMLYFSVAPWIAAIVIGIGAGALFPLNLLLPIDATTNGQEAASWSAMTQSAGYVIGAAGPLILGWIHDATQSFSMAVVALIALVVIMIVIQLIAVPRHDGQRERKAA